MATVGIKGLTGLLPYNLGTCEASWFDSISNHTSDSRFDSYWWSDSKTTLSIVIRNEMIGGG